MLWFLNCVQTDEAANFVSIACAKNIHNDDVILDSEIRNCSQPLPLQPFKKRTPTFPVHGV